MPRGMPHMASLLLLLVALMLSGCDLVGGEDGEETQPVTAGVIVGNGGVFGGEGALTLYNPATGRATTTEGMGGFINSLALHDGRFFVVTNSADLVTVLDTSSYAPVGQVATPRAPRHIAFAGPGKAYVTNLSRQNFDTGEVFRSIVSVIDLRTYEAVDSVQVGNYPEGVAVAAGKAFVANAGKLGTGHTLSVIDTQTDATVGTIDLGCDGPNAVFVDEEEEVVVVCRGRSSFSEEGPSDGEVVFVDAQTEAVVARVPFEVGVGSPNGTQGAYYAARAEALFVIDGQNTVYRIDTDANTLAGQIAVPETEGLVALSAVAYDALAGRLYLGRLAVGADGSPDYFSAGGVIILDDGGALQGRFEAGVAPAHIVLRRD